ncbi:Uncharacterised protein r2_g3331 [Pycnogonum litorale]
MAISIPTFTPFDATSELWKDYWSRFQTFAGAHAVPSDRLVQTFLTNQSNITYKFLSTLAEQQKVPMDELTNSTWKKWSPSWTRSLIPSGS